jgi:hypothetical protein
MQLLYSCWRFCQMSIALEPFSKVFQPNNRLARKKLLFPVNDIERLKASVSLLIPWESACGKEVWRHIFIESRNVFLSQRGSIDSKR